MFRTICVCHMFMRRWLVCSWLSGSSTHKQHISPPSGTYQVNSGPNPSLASTATLLNINSNVFKPKTLQGHCIFSQFKQLFLFNQLINQSINQSYKHYVYSTFIHRPHLKVLYIITPRGTTPLTHIHHHCLLLFHSSIFFLEFIS